MKPGLFSHAPTPQTAPRRGTTDLRFVAPPLPTPGTWVLDLLDHDEEDWT